MLKPPVNLKEIYLNVRHLKFLIVLYVCSDWEKTQLSHLDTKKHSSESLIKWFVNHNISYQVIYPIHIKSLIINPHKVLAYVKMQRNIKQYNAITKSLCIK